MSSTSTHTHARRAVIASRGAQIRDSKTISQEVSALLEAVDSIQHSQNETEELLRIALDDSTVLAMAREIGLAKGETLDEDKLRQALDEVRAQRFVFRPAEPGPALSVAQAWATRAQWGPRWRLRTAGVVGAVALGTGVSMGVSNYQENTWLNAVETTRSKEVDIRQNLENLLENAAVQANSPVPVAEQIGVARDAAVAGLNQIALAPSIPSTSLLGDMYEENRPGAKALLEERQARLSQAWEKHDTAKSALQKANALRVAYDDAKVFDQPIAVELTGLRDQQRVAFQMAAQNGNPEEMRTAVETLNEAVSIIQVKQALEAQAANMSQSTRDQLEERLDHVVTALSAGQISNAWTLVEDTKNLLAQASVGYTLKIVSEPGVQTGVWRYYGNDRSAKSYYIVVDAIGLDGNPVELPITSVEDKKTTMTSRFAVRVPENVYNEVGEDKKDGIVDNDLMAEKAVGDLEPNYAFPVVGGAITRW